MAPEKMGEKAQRLLNEGRVMPIVTDGDAGVYAIRGDTRTYLTTVLLLTPREQAQKAGADPAGCTCEARGLCSHILAADAAFKAQPR